MAIAKVILNDVTQMDVTQKTVTAGSMLSGTTALKNDGTSITGTIATKTATDITASGATVTVPAGYYASQTTKSVAAGSVTPAATISATGATISTATNNLTLSKTVSNTPAVSAGYVSAGTAGDSSVSLTAAVTIKGAATITPMDYAQTIPANTYLTGAQTIAAMPAGTAGTPIATKGTVSNNSVSVTPSVTNTAGYIQTQTKTGTAVTVTASELVSGSQTITENGTVDVTNLAQVVVDVASASGGHMVTIAGSGHSSRCYVQLNGAGQAYYLSGSTIPFSHSAGDELYIYCTGSLGGGTITVNGVQVANSPYDPVSYTLALPFADVTVNLSYGRTSQVDVTFTVPTIEITENGVHDVSEYGLANVAVGGSTTAEKKQVNFIDYDGTIVHSYTGEEANALTALPSNPYHTGLTAQGWNWTLAEIKAYLTAIPGAPIWVGQMYVTTSGDTEIDAHFADSARLSPYLNICVNGTVTIDWGDSTTPDTVTGTSLTTRRTPGHTYASTGDFTIMIHVASGSFQFYASSATYTLLSKNSTASENRVYASCVQAIRFGTGVTSLGGFAFAYCGNLKSITMPITLSSVGSYAIEYCYSLKSLILPRGLTASNYNSLLYSCVALDTVSLPGNMTSLGTASTFGLCYSLKNVTVPRSLTSLPSSTFSTCHNIESIILPDSIASLESSVFTTCSSLKSIKIPDSVTSIGDTAFQNCNGLASLTIPSGVTSIGNSAFASCYGIAEYHIKPTTPPTLGTTAFKNIASDCVIYVPRGALTDYQTATNWATYASYMQEEPA